MMCSCQLLTILVGLLLFGVFAQDDGGEGLTINNVQIGNKLTNNNTTAFVLPLTTQKPKSRVLEDTCNSTCIILISSGVLAFLMVCIITALYYAVCKDKESSFKEQTKTWEDVHINSRPPSQNGILDNPYTTDAINKKTNTRKASRQSAGSTLAGGKQAYDYGENGSVAYSAYSMDGYDLYTSPQYGNYPASYNRSSSLDYPDSVSYYDDTASRYSGYSGISQSRTVRKKGTAKSPQESSAERFYYNTIGHSGSSANKTPHDPEAMGYYNTIGASANKSKRSMSQSNMLTSTNMYTIQEAPGASSKPKKSNLKRTKSMPDNVNEPYPNYETMKPYSKGKSRFGGKRRQSPPMNKTFYQNAGDYYQQGQGAEMPTVYQDNYYPSSGGYQDAHMGNFASIKNELSQTSYFNSQSETTSSESYSPSLEEGYKVATDDMKHYVL